MSRRYLFLLAASVITIVTLGFFFEVIGLISYGLIVVSVWLAVGIFIAWLLALVLRKIQLVKRAFRLTIPLKLPLLLFVTGVAGIAIMNFYAPTALPPPTLSTSEQLAYMYKTDQGDRFALRFRTLNERDQQRLQKVLAFYEQDLVDTPKDQYHAAMILQHGTEAEHYELAYLLAKQASESGISEADGLWQNAYDRWMLSQGKPQLYGTQSTATFTLWGISFEQQ